MKGQQAKFATADDITQALHALQDAYGAAFSLTARTPGESEEHYANRVSGKLKTWRGALSRLSTVELAMGVQRCIREVPYAKTLTPADITTRAKLDPEAMGMPPARHAFIEAAREFGKPATDRKFTHPAVAVAGSQIATSDWRVLTAKQLWPQFEYAYINCVRRVLNNEDLAAVMPKALPQQPATEKPRKRTKEVAMAALEILKEKAR